MREHEHVGGRIRYWRSRRGGMTQAALAGLAGVDQSYISRVESGQRPIERRKTLVAIAKALQVSVADLLGQPGDPTDPTKAGISDNVPAIRLALFEIEEGERFVPQRAADEVDAVLDHLTRLRSQADFATEIPMLPGILPDAAAYGGVALARAAYHASTCLRRFGYRDLAFTAARISLTAAQDAEHTAWTGAARFAQMLAMPPEAAEISARIAARTLDEMQAQAADPEVRQVLGQLHLSAALASAIAGHAGTAEDRLAEADREAATLGDPVDGQGFNKMGFGPTNVALWRMAVVAELGDSEKVIDLSQRTNPEALNIVDRHQTYWIETGRALAHSGKTDRQAEIAFLRAERMAPVLFASHVMTREALSSMVRRAQRRAVSDDLRMLARRVGVDVPA